MTFIPQSAKEFPFKEGSILLSAKEDFMAFSIIKILSVEKIIMRAGDIKSILGQRIQAPEDDFFLVVSWKTTDYTYQSEEEAVEAIKLNRIPWKIGHIPSRPGSLTQTPKKLICYQEVTDEEIGIHKEWKKLFDENKAGVF